MKTNEQRLYNSEQEIKLLDQRDYLVVKSNRLVQMNRYKLSLPEQKLVAFICSMIRPIESSLDTYGKPFQLEYEFNIREYCKVSGIYYNSGENYNDIKANLQELRNKSMWITMPDGSETLCGWLSKVSINKRSGRVRIKLDEDLVPYLYDLKKRFTQYKLIQILGMKSAFSVRIYELLKSYSNLGRVEFEIDELKRLLMVDNVKSYADFGLFRTKVLEIALREINELTDLDIIYQTIRKGRKVIKVVFDISLKEEPQLSEALNKATEAISQNYWIGD